MLKKLRKTLNKEIKRRYDQMESNFLGLENRIYTTIEDRLASLEDKFEELSDILKDEIHSRKEKNEQKTDALEVEDTENNDTEEKEVLFSEKVEEVKDALVDKLKEAKETVTETAEKVSKTVKKAISGKNPKKGSKKTTKKAKKGKKETTKAPKTAKKVEGTENDLTKMNGLGIKMAEKLTAEGITTFAQLADLSSKDLKAIDDKIKSFAARFERYDWGVQAKDMK
jgi:predicted flap endonuclease-1-like 5' DNA nuclease